MKLFRKNAVHGEEEVKLVLTDRFQADDSTTNETAFEGFVDIEEVWPHISVPM